MNLARKPAFLSLATAALAALGSSTPGQEIPGGCGSGDRPSFVTTWQGLYPSSASFTNASCALCHTTTSGGEPWNPYGWAIRQNLSGQTLTEAILAVESANSDVDPCGESNQSEILLNLQPGWTNGANNTSFFKNGTTTGGLSAPAGVSGLLDPCFPTVVFNGSGLNPVVLSDTGGSATLSPRLNSAAQPFGVALDCSSAASNGIYLIQLYPTRRSTPLLTRYGELLCSGAVLQKFLGSHTRNTITIGPIVLPNDPTLTGVAYYVQGFCSDPLTKTSFLSNGLDQRVGTL